jgi:hypothetical protein
VTPAGSNGSETRVRRAVGWLAVRHPLRVEAALVVALYLVYECVRGLVVVDGASAAVAHARFVASLERSMHLFVEQDVQRAALDLPGMVGSLRFAYLSLHLLVTAAMLLWLHQRRPGAFPLVRTTLLLASALALVGFMLFPTAPPRLASLGIGDPVSGRHLSLDRGLVSSLYNPYAAVPSMHVGYALVVGASLFRLGGGRALRALGAVYPFFVLFVVVATGNHFFFDAVTGALTVAFAALAALRLTQTPTHARVIGFREHSELTRDPEEVAA